MLVLGIMLGLGLCLSTQMKYSALDLALRVRSLALAFDALVLVLGLEPAQPASTYKYMNSI